MTEAYLLYEGIKRIFKARYCCKQTIRSHSNTSANKRLLSSLRGHVADATNVSLLVSESRNEECARAGPMYIDACHAMYAVWWFNLILTIVYLLVSLGNKRAEVQGSHIAIFDDVERDESNDG